MTDQQPVQSQGNQPAPAGKKSNVLMYVLVGCGSIVIICGLIFGGIAWWGYHKAKQVIEKSAGDMEKAPELWSDVPRMDGMNGAQQIDMPLALKAFARPVMDTMMRGVNDGKNAGHWDWTSYSLKGKTTADIQKFYDAKRMSDAGWQANGGCTTMSTGSGQPTFCAFQKQDKATGLLIIAANDDEHQATSVFFIRQEAAAKTQ